MLVINIIDTCQLIEDANIINVLVQRGERIYIPDGVMRELKNYINHGKDEKKRKNAASAKKIVDRNKLWIEFISESGIGDATIQRIILSIMSESKLQHIKVYTFDKNLAKMCRAQNDNPTIKHNCKIEAYKYEKGKEIPTLNDNKKDNCAYVIKEIDGGELWRSNKYISSVGIDNSYNLSVAAKKGSINVIKYWIWHVKAGDYCKLYKKINLHAGEKISIDFLTYDDTCNVYARLFTYNTKNSKMQQSEKVYLSAGEWHNLSFVINGECDSINIELLPEKDSKGDENWNGTDGYIRNFRVEKSR